MTKTEIYTTIKDFAEEFIKGDTVTEEQLAIAREVIDRMDKDIELASKKSSNKVKVNPDKAPLVEAITEILAREEKPISIPQIIEALNAMDYKCVDGKTLTSQRISAMLTYMGAGTKQSAGLGIVEKSMEKKVAMFKLTAEDGADNDTGEDVDND